MRILGVDPGSIRMGWAVVEKRHDGAVVHVDNGVISMREEAPLPDRLVQIAAGLVDVIARLRPGVASVETAFHAKNARSALVLGQARGAAVLTCAQHGLPIAEYGPMQVKLAVTGSGKASKESVQRMVQTLMKLPEVAQQDASDAVALALTHAYISGRPRAILESIPKGPTRLSKKGGRAAWTEFVNRRG